MVSVLAKTIVLGQELKINTESVILHLLLRPIEVNSNRQLRSPIESPEVLKSIRQKIEMVFICFKSNLFANKLIYFVYAEYAPIFLAEDQEFTLYGVKGEPVTFEFWVYAHPDATIVWQYEGQKVC